MKLGKLGMLVGAAVGYVLGAKAGRERYEQITTSTRQLLDKPQVKKVVNSVPGDLGARMEKVANKAADKVQQAGDKVAASGPASGTSGSTTGTTTTTTTPATPSTSSTSAGTTETGTTETGTTTTKRCRQRAQGQEHLNGLPMTHREPDSPAPGCLLGAGGGQSAPVRSPARARL